LSLDGLSEQSLIVKVEESFAGGSSRQIQSVSENDMQILTDRVNEKISQVVSQSQPDQENKYILHSTSKTKQGNIEFGREIGEEADMLSANLETVVSYYSLLPQEESDIIKYISDKNNFDQSIDQQHSLLNFDFIKDSDLSGELFVSGKAGPLIDIDKISQQLVFKSNKNFVDILKSNVQRAYDFNLRSNSPFGNLPILPALKQNINLIIKTEL